MVKLLNNTDFKKTDNFFYQAFDSLCESVIMIMNFFENESGGVLVSTY